MMGDLSSPRGPFRLYTKESSTLPFQDYGILMDLAKGAKSVLEFGPGISTLAFIEAGVPRIVTCEHDEEWFEKAKTDFKDYPQVQVIRYSDVAPVALLETEGEFELAFVDSPKGYRKARKILPGQEDCSRLNTCLAALRRAPIVYLHDAHRPLERGSLGRLNAMGHKHEFLPARNGLARIVRK